MRLAITICAGCLTLAATAAPPPSAGAIERDARAAATSAPRLSGLRMPGRVVGQRGRARILVGVRLDRRARLRVQIRHHRTGALRRSWTDDTVAARGRTFLLLDAVNDRGFQLTAGVYRISVTARDAQGRTSNALERNFRLRLTAPRGIFDAYTVPLLPAFRRTEALGQLVAVVAPGGAAAAAGIRRGDVITRVGRHWITTPGSMARARRALLGRRTVVVRVRREGQLLKLRMTPVPNWVERRPFGPSLAVAARREPDSYAIAYARIAQLIDRGEHELAGQLLARLRRSWRIAAPARYLEGRIALASGARSAALGAFDRATTRDDTFAEALIAQGALLARDGARQRALAIFRRADAADPRSAEAAAFEAYMHLRDRNHPAALAAADRALRRDPLYPDAQIPRGIALIALDRKAAGLQALRRGVLDLADRPRAEVLLARIERADP